jgi:hypothetical protein
LDYMNLIGYTLHCTHEFNASQHFKFCSLTCHEPPPDFPGWQSAAQTK